MNGPITMYNLKPIVHFADPVVLTPSMYRMKNIYSSSIAPPKFQETNAKPDVLEQKSSEVECLKKRQESILRQLIYLKERMFALRQELSKKDCTAELVTITSDKDDITSSVQVVNKQPSWSGVIQEIVVHASPECPPYSLLAVNQLWPDILCLQLSCHTHSSLVELPSHTSVFSALAHTPSPTLNVRLVWKNMGPDCELIISPLTHCAIRGEVNLLRYLYRTICTTSNIIDEINLDNILDICHQLTHAHTQRDKLLQVRTLNARLGKATWLGGNKMSVADIAAWSALRSSTGVELSQNMTKWLSRCSAAIGVEAA